MKLYLRVSWEASMSTQLLGENFESLKEILEIKRRKIIESSLADWKGVVGVLGSPIGTASKIVNELEDFWPSSEFNFSKISR